MKKRYLLLVILISLVCTIWITHYFSKKPRQETQTDKIEREALAFSQALQNYQRGDLIYRIGQGPESVNQALYHLKKSIAINQNIQKRILSSKGDPLFDLLIEATQTLSETTREYLEMIKAKRPSEPPSISPALLGEFSKTHIQLHEIVKALAHYQKKHPEFSQNDFILIAKELLLSTYKLDSYENRFQIYKEMTDLLHQEMNPGHPLYIGKKIDFDMKLHYITHHPKDALYNTLFSDLEQTLPLFGILPENKENMPQNALQLINRRFVYGKILQFSQLKNTELSYKPDIIVLTEDGKSLQEYLLEMGLAKIDKNSNNAPERWNTITTKETQNQTEHSP